MRSAGSEGAPVSRARHLLAVAVVALCLGALLPAPGGAVPASAASSSETAEQRRSTRVPMPTPEGRLSSYVVNAARPWTENTAAVERAVRRTGGVVVQSWPQIGVVVAHSRRETFRQALRRRDVVASVGVTRTVRVLEGTPGTARPTARRT